MADIERLKRMEARERRLGHEAYDPDDAANHFMLAQRYADLVRRHETGVADADEFEGPLILRNRFRPSA